MCTRWWLILCSLSPLFALPSPRELQSNDHIISKSSAQHELVAHLVYYLRKHAISSILRLELFTIASGNHFTIPKDGISDVNLHRRAQALARLWTRLDTMEHVDDVINSATVQVAIHSTSDFPDEKIVEALLKNIEHRLKAEETIYGEYLALKNVTSVHTCKLFFKVQDFHDDQYEDAFMEWIAEPAMKRYFVNKLFLQQSSGKKEYFKMAKGLMSLAQNSNWASTAQKIYDETIDEIAGDFSVVEHPYESNYRIFKNYGYELRVDRTTAKLFERLVEKCQKFPKLNDKLEVIKEKFEKEKILENQENRVINLFPL